MRTFGSNRVFRSQIAKLMPAAIGGLCLVLSGCGGARVSNETGGIPNTARLVVSIPSAERRTAPEIQGTDLDGEQFTLSSLRGQTVVLNVWASWCGPCRAESADFERAHKQLPDVQFVGIAVRDSEAAARAFLRSRKVTYPSLFDPTSESTLLFAKIKLPAVAIPTTYVIDPDGKVAARALTPLKYNTLMSLIEAVTA